MEAKQPAGSFPQETGSNPALLSSLSELVNRLDSRSFQSTHATRIENDLGFSANKVLYVLGSSGPCRPSELAVRLATGRANVSKVIRSLDEQGLTVRTRDPRDSRAFLIALTPAGGQRAGDVFGIGEKMLQEVMVGWSTIEVAAFTGLMARFNQGVAGYERRLNTALKATPRPPRPSPPENREATHDL